MSCDYDILKKLLREKGYADAVEHAEAVRWKIIQAKFYARLAKEKDFAAFLAQYQGNELTANDPALRDSLFQCEAHTISMAQPLHSVADIMAQVVNDSIATKYGIQLNEKDIQHKAITDRL